MPKIINIITDHPLHAFTHFGITRMIDAIINKPVADSGAMSLCSRHGGRSRRHSTALASAAAAAVGVAVAVVVAMVVAMTIRAMTQ